MQLLLALVFAKWIGSLFKGSQYCSICSQFVFLSTLSHPLFRSVIFSSGSNLPVKSVATPLHLHLTHLSSLTLTLPSTKKRGGHFLPSHGQKKLYYSQKSYILQSFSYSSHAALKDVFQRGWSRNVLDKKVLLQPPILTLVFDENILKHDRGHSCWSTILTHIHFSSNSRVWVSKYTRPYRVAPFILWRNGKITSRGASV